MKMLLSSSTITTTTGIVHKEAKGGTSHAYLIREVIIITQISIGINLP
jgi:hypothetical protein